MIGERKEPIGGFCFVSSVRAKHLHVCWGPNVRRFRSIASTGPGPGSWTMDAYSPLSRTHNSFASPFDFSHKLLLYLNLWDPLVYVSCCFTRIHSYRDCSSCIHPHAFASSRSAAASRPTSNAHYAILVSFPRSSSASSKRN